MNANVATEFFMTVMRNASAVVSNAACRLMGNTNLLLDTLKSFVKLSPYSPFGTYIFFTESEKVVVVSNPDAVLQILFYACQLSSESECDYIAQQSLKAHWGYESKMQQNLEQLHAIRLDELAKLPLSLTGRNTPITEALDELGLVSSLIFLLSPYLSLILYSSTPIPKKTNTDMKYRYNKIHPLLQCTKLFALAEASVLHKHKVSLTGLDF